jgi:hypothetical protein
MTPPADERPFQPLEYWNIIRRRRWAVLACTVVVPSRPWFYGRS